METPVDVDLTKEHVFFAMPTHRDIAPSTTLSLLGTQQLFTRCKVPHDILIASGNSLPHHARSKMAADFLESDASILAWVDSDVSWDAQSALRMSAMAAHYGCVTAAYPSRHGDGRYAVTLLDEEEVTTNEHGLMPIRHTGIGFAFIKRRIIEQLADRSPSLRFHGDEAPIPAIFRCDDLYGEARGEDVAFWHDVADLGHTVWLDPNIRLGHTGCVTFTGRFADDVLRLKPGAPPAEEKPTS